MRRIFPILPMILPALAACGGGGERVSIRGSFADTALVPTAVFAVEAERQVEVKRGGFDLRDLSAGPVTLRLVRGVDTVGTVALHNVPAGTSVDLTGLETDGLTGRAFPRSVSLSGSPVLLVNNLRMGRGDAVPAEVDARGLVLAASDDRAALLVRPADAAMPDLRVVMGLATETMAPDSAPFELAGVRAGDSVRVVGRADGGFVVATRLVVWRPAATAMREEASASPEPRRAASSRPSPSSPRPSPSTREPAVVAVPASVARAVRQQIDRAQRGGGGGRGRGNGRGHGKKG